MTSTRNRLQIKGMGEYAVVCKCTPTVPCQECGSVGQVECLSFKAECLVPKTEFFSYLCPDCKGKSNWVLLEAAQ